MKESVNGWQITSILFGNKQANSSEPLTVSSSINYLWKLYYCLSENVINTDYKTEIIPIVC